MEKNNNFPSVYYIFNPIQFKEFGYYFFKGEGFYYRYQMTKKLFYKSIYIPFGPNCLTKEGFNNFLTHIKSFNFTKLVIDLPMIYNRTEAYNIIQKLKKMRFKEIPYIHQDEETIILLKNQFHPKSKVMNKIRHGLKFVNIIVKDQINDPEIDKIYNIYLYSSARIGFQPKTKDVFKKLSENSLVSLAYNKKTNEIEGFVFGYVFEANQDILESGVKKILLIVFTALSETGRTSKIGHAIHYFLFKEAFENWGIEIIDFHGASRTKNRKYLEFKKDWDGQFYSLPGSFKNFFLF